MKFLYFNFLKTWFGGRIILVIRKILEFYDSKIGVLNNSSKNEYLVSKYPVLQKLEVLNGPFVGLKYPDQIAFGSTYIPKLIGSY